MKSDEGFLNNVDKQMLNQLVNENVRLISFLKNSKRWIYFKFSSLPIFLKKKGHNFAAFFKFINLSGITFSFKQSISIVLSNISENPSSLFITI